LGPKGEAEIEALEALGSEVLYIKSNVSRYEEVKYLVKKTKSRFQSIDGIVHAAGITRNAFLQNKTHEDVKNVLAPKVHGTICLDLATKKEKLDFIVFFSSMASVVGSSGQCDYAYANSFMDYYALRRERLRKLEKRSGRTVSINWPLWKEGGMKVDQQTKRFLQNTMGVDLLETEAGLKSLTKIIARGDSQVLVLTGEAEKYEQMLNKASGLEITGSKDNRSKSRRGRVTGAESKYLLELSKDIVRIVSGISGIKENRINTGKSLIEYGFDSIIFVEFANQMNEKYNFALSPAVFFEYSSISALSQYLVYEHQEQISQHYAGNSTANGGTPASIKHTDLKSVPDINTWPRFQAEDFDTGRQEPAVTRETEPVAVIGISGVMPQSEDLETFWSHLTAGSDLITKVPKDRWDGGAFSQVFTHAGILDKDIYGGFIKDVDKFDALFFGISPHEAELMDPQQRIFLETVWQAVEDAGYRMSDLSGTKTGLFVGVSAVDYAEIVKQHGVKIKGHLATGLAHSVLANRISYLFNFHGPSEPVDTACSSSLIALHRAVESIRSGDCEIAVAGGVNILLSPTVFVSFLEAGMLSEDGKCKTFDSSANGYVRGEGIGAVVLKPLNRAIKDQDHVYGIIKATAINHGGRAASLTAPNMIAQAELIIEACEKADVDPATINYIEAHGTGTGLGDPIEVDGLKKAFTELYKRRGQPLQKGYCGIGSVKTNMGHLEAAAGIAGLLKVLLAMKSKQLPASIHFKELNPHINLDDSPFYVVSKTKPWGKMRNHENQPVPRRAGLSSFGFGGANAHVVVEEYNNSTIRSRTLIRESQVIVLSARNKNRLKKYAGKMVEFLRKAEHRKKASEKPTGQDESHDQWHQTAPFNLIDLAYTLQVGREPMEERLAVMATSLKEVKDKLAQYCMGEKDIEGFFQGCPAENRSMAKFLLEGNEGSLYMNAIIKEKNLEKLAKLWVSGIDPDWKQLYTGQSPRRLSLPTYPFARKRYWVEMNESVTQVESKRVYAITSEESERNSYREVLSKYEPDQRREVLESFLLQQVSRTLKLDRKQKLDRTQPLVTMGFDSLLALQLKKEIGTHLHLDTDAINLFGAENIADLAKLILPYIVKEESELLNSSKIDEAKHSYEQDDLIMGVL
jgi:polyketide synthase PksN